MNLKFHSWSVANLPLPFPVFLQIQEGCRGSGAVCAANEDTASAFATTTGSIDTK